jgi:hypothetical protein
VQIDLDEFLFAVKIRHGDGFEKVIASVFCERLLEQTSQVLNPRTRTFAPAHAPPHTAQSAIR